MTVSSGSRSGGRGRLEPGPAAPGHSAAAAGQSRRVTGHWHGTVPGRAGTVAQWHGRGHASVRVRITMSEPEPEARLCHLTRRDSESVKHSSGLRVREAVKWHKRASGSGSDMVIRTRTLAWPRHSRRFGACGLRVEARELKFSGRADGVDGAGVAEMYGKGSATS